MRHHFEGITSARPPGVTCAPTLCHGRGKSYFHPPLPRALSIATPLFVHTEWYAAPGDTAEHCCCGVCFTVSQYDDDILVHPPQQRRDIVEHRASRLITYDQTFRDWGASPHILLSVTFHFIIFIHPSPFFVILFSSFFAFLYYFFFIIYLRHYITSGAFCPMKIRATMSHSFFIAYIKKWLFVFTLLGYFDYFSLQRHSEYCVNAFSSGFHARPSSSAAHAFFERWSFQFATLQWCHYIIRQAPIFTPLRRRR